MLEEKDQISFYKKLMNPNDQSALIEPLLELHDYYGDLIIHNNNYGHNDEIRSITNLFAEITFLRITSLIELIERPHFTHKKVINVRFDINSIAGISRSLLEASLLTYFFLRHCANREHTEISILFWKYASLKSRLNSFKHGDTSTTSEGSNSRFDMKLKSDYEKLNEYKKQIFNSSLYNKLDEENKKIANKLLTRNKSLVSFESNKVFQLSWNELIKRSISDKSPFKHRIYSFLSAHSHSNWISLLQFSELNTSDSSVMIKHIHAITLIAMFASCMFISETCNHFLDNLDNFKKSKHEHKVLIQYMNSIRGTGYNIKEPVV